jgi:hypothetical protein
LLLTVHTGWSLKKFFGLIIIILGFLFKSFFFFDRVLLLLRTWPRTTGLKLSSSCSLPSSCDCRACATVPSSFFFLMPKENHCTESKLNCSTNVEMKI